MRVSFISTGTLSFLLIFATFGGNIVSAQPQRLTFGFQETQPFGGVDSRWNDPNAIP